MVEYGNGVGQTTGVGGGSGGGSGDAVAAFGQFVGDAVDRVAALPPSTIALAIIVILVGLLILRRAF